MYKKNFFIDYKRDYEKLQSREIPLAKRKSNYQFSKNSIKTVQFSSRILNSVVDSTITLGISVSSIHLLTKGMLVISKGIFDFSFDLIDKELETQIEELENILNDIDNYEKYQSNVPSDLNPLEKLLNPSNKNLGKKEKKDIDWGKVNIDNAPRYDNVNYDRGNYENIA